MRVHQPALLHHKRFKIVSWLYHDVTDSPGESGFQNPNARIYKISVSHFIRNLAHILGSGCLLRTITNPENKSNFNTLSLNYLTFDDGGVSAMTAADILDLNNVKGHFFITTNKIGCPGFMGESQIRELHERGHVVGSHSHTHPSRFDILTSDKMFQEWSISTRILAKITGQPTVAGSVPGGNVNHRVVQAAGLAGIRHLFTSCPTYQTRLLSGVQIYGRLRVRRSTTLLLCRWGSHMYMIWPITALWYLKRVVRNVVMQEQKESSREIW